MNEAFTQRIYKTHQLCPNCPPTEQIAIFFEDLLGLLFPNFTSQPIESHQSLTERFDELKKRFKDLLNEESGTSGNMSGNMTASFFDAIPGIYDLLQQDIDAIHTGDPAAKSREEVIRSYPGFFAIAAYRMANKLHGLGVGTLPRSITEYAHNVTGIDIHPASIIGERFCIDHGTGIVIGETSVIGSDVKIYQGVTLGALSVSKSLANVKRHPTIGNKVVIYSGATILGGDTKIGDNCIIGGNVWLTSSVPANAKVYYQPVVINGETQDEIIIKQA